MAEVTDFPDFQVPQAHATAVAATGVPLLSKPNVLVSSLLQSIPASGTQHYGPVTLTQTGYAIQILVQFPVAATSPYVEVVLTWSDPVSSTVYGEQHYWVPGAAPPTAFTTLGEGPARSNQLTVTVNNNDPAQAATVSLLVAQDSVGRNVDRWYYRNAADNGLVVPGHTLAALPDDESVLGLFNAITVAVSTTATFLCGMAPGQRVTLAGVASGIAASSIAIQVAAAPESVYGTPGLLLQADITDLNENFTFTAPRSPLLFKIRNNATSGTLTFSGMLVAAD